MFLVRGTARVRFQWDGVAARGCWFGQDGALAGVVIVSVVGGFRSVFSAVVVAGAEHEFEHIAFCSQLSIYAWQISFFLCFFCRWLVPFGFIFSVLLIFFWCYLIVVYCFGNLFIAVV